MSVVRQQVARARQRLALNAFLRQLALGVLIAAGLWAAATLVARLAPLTQLDVWAAGAAAAGLAVVFGLVGLALSAPAALAAARALDQAAGLKERLSTALAAPHGDAEFAQAVRRDAERVAATLHVPSHIRVQAPTLAGWSLVAALGAAGLAWLLPTMPLFARQPEPAPGPELRSMAQEEYAQIKTDFDQRASTVAELAKNEPELSDLADALKPLEMPQGPNLTPDDVRRESLRRIDDVAQRLDEKLTGAEAQKLTELERMLKQLALQPEKLSTSDDALKNALASGDFKAAREALEKKAAEIREAAKNAEDPAAQEKLEAIRKQLDDLSKQLAQLDDSSRMQRELENKAGLDQQAAKELMDKLSKMDPNQAADALKKALSDKGLSKEQIEQLAQKLQQSKQAQQAAKELAQKLSAAAQSAGQCQNPGQADGGASGASQSLSDAGEMLSDLETAEQTLRELQSLRDSMSDLREGVCKSPGRSPDPQDRIGQQGPQYGLGEGSRVGRDKAAHQTTVEKASVRRREGQVIGRMLVNGPQSAGEVSAEEQAAAQADVRAALDAVERENVPRQYQGVVQLYFERLAGLVGQAAPPPAPAPNP